MINAKKYIPAGIALASAAAFLWAGSAAGWSLAGLFLTRDQQGRRLMAQHQYEKAALVFDDPLRRGAAQYKAGDFKAAAASFGQVDSPAAHYNRANAMLMLGDYDGAIGEYQRALALKPEWREAAENLALAKLRRKLLEPQNDGDQGTGGMLEADEIVFDKPKNKGGEEQTEPGGKQKLSAEELQAMWLRRVQTKPADFLRAKFSYQQARLAAKKQNPPQDTNQ